MFREVEKAAERLADGRAGWVTRRDAAEALGEVAERALRALKARVKDADVDVKTAAERALGRVSAALAGHPAMSGYTLEELAKACAKDGSRTVSREGDAYVVEVKTGENRRQRVCLALVKGRVGRLLEISTRCGKADADVHAWALRANMDIALGALAMMKDGDDDILVLRGCYLPDQVSPSEVKACVKELAHYGDWLESRLSGSHEDAE